MHELGIFTNVSNLPNFKSHISRLTLKNVYVGMCMSTDKILKVFLIKNNFFLYFRHIHRMSYKIQG